MTTYPHFLEHPLPVSYLALLAKNSTPSLASHAGGKKEGWTDSDKRYCLVLKKPYTSKV